MVCLPQTPQHAIECKGCGPNYKNYEPEEAMKLCAMKGDGLCSLRLRGTFCTGTTECENKTENPYADLGRQIGNLVAEKQRAYGNSFGKCGEFLRILYPNGIKPEEYETVLFHARMFDKQMRLATSPTALEEDPAQDMLGYCMLEVSRRRG